MNPSREREKKAAYNRAYYAAKRDELVNYSRNYRASNRESVREADRARYAADPARKKAINKASAARCAQRKYEYNKRWRAENRDRARATARAYLNRVGATPERRLANRIRCGIYDALNRGKLFRKSVEIVGWSIPELRAHLERQFLRGMSWENMGEWHIDHIIPLASFRIASVDDPQLRRAWALTNLRPMWAKANIRKGARVETLL